MMWVVVSVDEDSRNRAVDVVVVSLQEMPEDDLRRARAVHGRPMS